MGSKHQYLIVKSRLQSLTVEGLLDVEFILKKGYQPSISFPQEKVAH